MDYSSSITLPSFKYDVFLSFRGEDTGYSFTSHLYEALRYKQIEVYVDHELQLQRGEEISQAHLKAITESKVSVIVFTKTYAYSRWCLEELVHILECKKLYKQIVIPVFYGIEPADVRRPSSYFSKGFRKYEERLYYISVQRWWNALNEAANISGFDLRDFNTESELIETIVEDILNRLNETPLKIVDIREEDSGHQDEEAIQVPKITVERMFVAANLILEVPSAVFDQLSSVHKPQYILVSMLMSLSTMLICITELVYKGREARVGWRWRKKIPWFYHPSPSDKPFGTVTDFIGLLCSFIQCIFSLYYYVFYLRNINYPIKISIWPLVFAFCLLCSTFSKKSPKKEALL